MARATGVLARSFFLIFFCLQRAASIIFFFPFSFLHPVEMARVTVVLARLTVVLARSLVVHLQQYTLHVNTLRVCY